MEGTIIYFLFFFNKLQTNNINTFQKFLTLIVQAIKLSQWYVVGQKRNYELHFRCTNVGDYWDLLNLIDVSLHPVISFASRTTRTVNILLDLGQHKYIYCMHSAWTHIPDKHTIISQQYTDAKKQELLTLDSVK